MTTDTEIRARHHAERKANLESELQQHGWSLTLTARALGIAINYLQWMIEHFGLAEQYAQKGHHTRGNPHKENT
jgi:transposase-like protein